MLYSQLRGSLIQGRGKDSAKIAFLCALIMALFLIAFSQPAFADNAPGDNSRHSAFVIHFKNSGGASPNSWGGCAGYFVLEMNHPGVVAYGTYAQCTEPVSFTLTVTLQDCDSPCIRFYDKDKRTRSGVATAPYVADTYTCTGVTSHRWRVKLSGNVRGQTAGGLSDEEDLPCAF